MVIDLIADIDALESEPQLFDENYEGVNPADDQTAVL